MCTCVKVTGSWRKLNTSQANSEQESSESKRVHSTCRCLHGCYHSLWLVSGTQSIELNVATFVAVFRGQMRRFLYG